MPPFRFGLLAIGLLFFSASYGDASQPLCVNHEGNFIGLAIDENAWDSIEGAIGSPGEHPWRTRAPGTTTDPIAQKWILTKEEPAYGGELNGPRNSYAGHFLQVLPDTGRSYPKRGEHLKRVEDLVGVSPYVSFLLRVTKEGAGLHTLFVRWTGGDSVGGGDSFFVAMHRAKGKGEKEFISGERTFKPVVTPITSGLASFAGCCYDHVTHACPCLLEVPVESDDACPEEGHSYVDRDSAVKFGVQCEIGRGDMEMVEHPKWYLFAGQEEGDVMDFDSEPWDGTCEAEGSNTRDSGHDFPSWNLTPGEYELRIYAREDGTALDGIFVVGPEGEAPGIEQRYTEGDSTICYQSSFAAVKNVGISLLACLAFGGLFAFILFTETGKNIKHSVEMRLQSHMHRNNARESLAQYAQFDQLSTIG